MRLRRADRWPPDDLENPLLIRKNVAQAVFTEEHWLLKSILDALFGPIDSLDSMIRAGQYLGAHGLRYAVDAPAAAGQTSWGIDHLGFQRALAQWRRTLPGGLRWPAR